LVYRIQIGIVLLLVVGLMFGCGGDNEVADDGHGHDHDHVHGDEGDDFDEVASSLGLFFNDPATAGRPSPSFSADISPILTSRCAIPGCHVAGGPHDVDLRTYDTISAGGDDGAIVIADNARESEVVKQIVQGRMPPGGPPLEAAQTQLIIDWINEGAKNN
jgi:hypothetical protein